MKDGSKGGRECLRERVERGGWHDHFARVTAVGEDPEHPSRRGAQARLSLPATRALAARVAVHRRHPLPPREIVHVGAHLDDAPDRFVPRSDGESDEGEPPLPVEKIAMAHGARFGGDSYVSRLEIGG